MEKRVNVLASVFFAAALAAEGAVAGGPSAVPAKVRLVSYNIHHCRGMDNKVSVARTAAAIMREKPDFAGLQEVDRNVDRSGFADQPKELARLTGMHATFAKAIPLGERGEYGVAVLSREKPLSVRRTPLPGPEPRVLLLCEFADCWFGSTHLDSGILAGGVNAAPNCPRSSSAGKSRSARRKSRCSSPATGTRHRARRPTGLCARS